MVDRDQRSGEELTAKGNGNLREGDVAILCLDCGGNYSVICIC